MIAIETRYMPAIDTRGSRIKTKWRKRNMPYCSIPYDCAFSSLTNHYNAVLQLIETTNSKQSENYPSECWFPGETEHGYIWIYKPLA